jgi:hypothetical protein
MNRESWQDVGLGSLIFFVCFCWICTIGWLATNDLTWMYVVFPTGWAGFTLIIIAVSWLLEKGL